MQKTVSSPGGKRDWLNPSLLYKVFGAALFLYLFLGFMVVPCLNTLTSIFTTKDAAGNTDPLTASAVQLMRIRIDQPLCKANGLHQLKYTIIHLFSIADQPV